MATQRYISTSFWDDEWIQTLDPSEKFLYLYFMTNPLTNIAGVYKITLRRMVFDTGFNEDTIKRIISRFEADNKAFFHDGYLILPTWPKHQKWQDRSKIQQGIEAILEELSPEMRGYLLAIGYLYPIDTLSVPYAYLRNYSDSDSDSDSDIDSDSDLDLYMGGKTADGSDDPPPEPPTPPEVHTPLKDCEKPASPKSEEPPIPSSQAGAQKQSKKQRRQRFVKPTIEEVRDYARAIKFESLDAKHFWDFYESKGWMIGKNRMKDWRAAVRTWDRNEKQYPRGQPLPLRGGFKKPEGYEYSIDDVADFGR